MTFDGNDQTAGHGGNPRNMGKKGINQNEDERIILKITGELETDRVRWSVIYTKPDHPAAKVFKEIFGSQEYPQSAGTETVIWQLAEAGTGDQIKLETEAFSCEKKIYRTLIKHVFQKLSP